MVLSIVFSPQRMIPQQITQAANSTCRKGRRKGRRGVQTMERILSPSQAHSSQNVILSAVRVLITGLFLFCLQ